MDCPRITTTSAYGDDSPRPYGEPSPDTTAGLAVMRPVSVLIILCMASRWPWSAVRSSSSMAAGKARAVAECGAR